jgi:geranylgeranyl diphosphate synthase type II
MQPHRDSWRQPAPDDGLSAYLAETRALVLEEIETILPKGGPLGEILYERMRDYPLRPAKGLRPALCLAICRAVGGSTAAALRTAAVLELYHNAFLIHDDVEDGSVRRRTEPTLSAAYGDAIAVNVGDAMLLLCQEALDENLRLLGLGPALRIRRVLADMTRETVEGQAVELEWIRNRRWGLTDRDYLRMVHKKTTWYSFTAPLVLGAMIGGLPTSRHFALRCLAALVGAAFQIQDDVLNLEGDPDHIGKEALGDLWEGKHTLVLEHAMRTVDPERRRLLEEALAKDRPGTERFGRDPGQEEARLFAELNAAGVCDGEVAHRVARWMHARDQVGLRTAADVEALHAAIVECRSIPYARGVARTRIRRAESWMRAMHAWLEPSTDRDFLDSVLAYVVRRTL